MANKITVGILMGGPSSEHEISLLSGKAFLRHLNRNRYHIHAIKISRKGGWLFDSKPIKAADAIKKLDVALLALHGEFGEDGRMQAFLEHHSLPYSGSGVVASALGMDKLISRSIFKANGLFVPRIAGFSKEEVDRDFREVRKKIFRLVGTGPWIVKPRSRGSSVGVGMAKTADILLSAMRKALRFENNILVEEYIQGIEVTVPILEKGGRTEVLPLVEIRPRKSAFFDYEEKYSGENGAEEIIPARVSKSLLVRAAVAGLDAYNFLGCRGYARADIIIAKGRPYILEMNTLPGMTPVSLFPKAAKVAGIDFPELLDILILKALQKHKRG